MEKADYVVVIFREGRDALSFSGQYSFNEITILKSQNQTVEVIDIMGYWYIFCR